MNDYLERDAFEFGNESNNNTNSFNYGEISGLGESDYENEDLFNTEVSTNNKIDSFEIFRPQSLKNSDEDLGYNVEVPIDYQAVSLNQGNDDAISYSEGNNQNKTDELPTSYESLIQNYSDEEETENQYFDNDFDSQKVDLNYEQNEVVEKQNFEEDVVSSNNDFFAKADEQETSVEQVNSFDNFEVEESDLHNETIEKIEEDVAEETEKISEPIVKIDNEFLDDSGIFGSASVDDSYELPVIEPKQVTKQVEESKEPKKEFTVEEKKSSIIPSTDLSKLTEFKEDNIKTTDIKDLFDRVGVNVKEASDIFKKNTEMKEKIDSRFEELKKLQAEVEKSKKSQYDEINSYKEEVLNKLTEKKEEIEKRLNRLKEYQANLEKEREEFEQYRKTEKEEIERVQKEVQEAYDGRREELNHIEDVLRKQKDVLDEERSQLSLDRIQYESDKNELANNLLKFNEIVGSFTNGMEKLNKE